jgi:hypothetical protein
MTMDKEAPAAVLPDGESRRNKAKMANFILSVVNTQKSLKVLKGD